jgi:hypothetical protein
MNIARTSGHFMYARKFSGKRTFYVTCVKRPFFCQWSYWSLTICLFFTHDTKVFLFHENLCTNMECPDVRVDIFFKFFIF